LRGSIRSRGVWPHYSIPGAKLGTGILRGMEQSTPVEVALARTGDHRGQHAAFLSVAVLVRKHIPRVSYLEYDWGLNDRSKLRQASQR